MKAVVKAALTAAMKAVVKADEWVVPSAVLMAGLKEFLLAGLMAAH